MILVTVGTQLPFDRLVKIVDCFAATSDRRFVAQIGTGDYRPKHMEWITAFEGTAFNDLFAQAEVVVSHAGIGTVLTARKFDKPLIVFPRRTDFGEHRNDHQLATVKQLQGQSGVYVAMAEQDLIAQMSGTLVAPSAGFIDTRSRDRLVSYLKAYIDQI